jgi:hypothetical protein
LLELFRQNLFNLRDQSRVIGILFNHQLESISGFLIFSLSTISEPIFAEDLVANYLFIVLAYCIDMVLDGFHEEATQRRTIGFPTNGSIFLNSGNTCNPRLFIFTLQLLDLID